MINNLCFHAGRNNNNVVTSVLLKVRFIPIQHPKQFQLRYLLLSLVTPLFELFNPRITEYIDQSEGLYQRRCEHFDQADVPLARSDC